VKFYVANTDSRWFRFLESAARDTDVNFWRPRGGGFKAVESGDLFFLRLKAPVSAIAGFGTFVTHTQLPIHLAWDAFGAGNGADSREELIELIRPYRSAGDDAIPVAWVIGCSILANVHYFAADELLPLAWPPGLVAGRTYDSSEAEGIRIWSHMRDYLAAHYPQADTIPNLAAKPEFSLVGEDQGRYGVRRIRERIGQGAFRVLVLDAYGRRCAVTSERTVPVVEAAHIQPYLGSLSNHVQNGIAMRSDLHTLFDLGYLAVDDAFRIVVSGRIKAEFENGRDYYKLHGVALSLPRSRDLRPSQEALEWHRTNVFAA
jgi:putative restriction endonuclease